MKLILGSTSKRRQEILSFFSYPFEIMAPLFDEKSLPHPEKVEDVAPFLALHKALSFPSQDTLILTADTIVAHKGEALHKPQSLEEAYHFLNRLSDDWHEVHTAVVARHGDRIERGSEVTRVRFNRLNDSQIKHYFSSLNPFEYAGGFAIQKAGSLVVNKIEGCFYNVMGLPLNTTREVLCAFGLDLWHYLPSAY